MWKGIKSVRSFSTSGVGPRFLLLLKRKPWGTEDRPAKDSKAAEAGILIASSLVLFAILTLIVQVLRSR